jgi:RND family efflux transporter MFP subunit
MKLPPMRLLAPALIAIVLIVSLAAYLAPSSPGEADDALVAKVRQGDFAVLVTTAGELRARKFVQIQGPTNAQGAEMYNLKIASIVPEGTRVQPGDVVAELDRSSVAPKITEINLALAKAEALATQAQLDSTLTLSQAREDHKGLQLALEEKRIAREQAIYEAPSIKRQAEIDYERAQRAVAQAESTYKTKTQQAVAKMQEVQTDVTRQQNRLKAINAVMDDFTIRAPSPGMVIYVREWNGKKKGVGSAVSPWEPTVATLPDLSQMESLTYVNELDVRKIGVGQTVRVALDADPSKKLTGKVTTVANVGEQRPNADAKVFEVTIAIQEADTTLRPGMTTSNAIEALTLTNVLSVPLDAIESEGDIPYVYKRIGARVVRQQIRTGAMNDVDIVIVAGLDKDDEILLVAPSDRAKIETIPLADK